MIFLYVKRNLLCSFVCQKRPNILTSGHVPCTSFLTIWQVDEESEGSDVAGDSGWGKQGVGESGGRNSQKSTAEPVLLSNGWLCR